MGQALQAGSILGGKYRLEHVLGRGGMGTVHLATHVLIGQRVAIKIVEHGGTSGAGTRDREYVVARFLREARAAARLASEHVVRILDVGEGEDGTPFMVMEYLQGTDLSALLRTRGRLPTDEAVSCVLEACEALAEAHAAGIVHRDLKPSNLFRAETARGSIVKLLDFGISKLSTPGEDLALTDTQAVMGSPLYMSPEQLLSSRDVDHRTDIWSLGITLYQLVSGALPFEASTASSMGAHIAARPPRPLSTLLPEIPRDLEAAVMRCLEREPTARFPDVASLARALAPFGVAHAKNPLSGIDRAAARGGEAPAASISTSTPPPPPPGEASGDRWTRSRVSPSEPPPDQTHSRHRRTASSVSSPASMPEPVLLPMPAVPAPVPAAPRSRKPLVVALVLTASLLVVAVALLVSRASSHPTASTSPAVSAATPASPWVSVPIPVATLASASASASATPASPPVAASARPSARPHGRSTKPSSTWSKDPSELDIK